jgi:hypothetical protein
MTQQQPQPQSQPNLKLPFAAFVLVLVGGVIIALILSRYSVDAALFVFGLSVVLSVFVALGIIFDDRAEFREMSRTEQQHGHVMQRQMLVTERLKIRAGTSLPRLVEGTPPDPNWQVKQLPQPAQSLQRVDDTHWRVLPVAPVEVRSVPMSDGTTRTVRLNQLEAIFKSKPQPSQAKWLENKGGDVYAYTETCELLCSSEPPLLLRKPPPSKGYEWAGDDAFLARWWDEIVNGA